MLACTIGPETRKEKIALLNLSWEEAHEAAEMFATMCVWADASESWANTDCGVAQCSAKP